MVAARKTKTKASRSWSQRLAAARLIRAARALSAGRRDHPVSIKMLARATGAPESDVYRYRTWLRQRGSWPWPNGPDGRPRVPYTGRPIPSRRRQPGTYYARRIERCAAGALTPLEARVLADYHAGWDDPHDLAQRAGAAVMTVRAALAVLRAAGRL